MQAVWNGTMIAQSDDTAVVEGNPLLPRGRDQIGALRAEFDDDRLSVERHRELLHRGGRRCA